MLLSSAFRRKDSGEEEAERGECMNDEQLDKLFEAARAAKPNTSPTEFGFETRLLARIRAEAQQQLPWFAFAWKLMPAFAVVVLALGVWNLTNVEFGPADLHAAVAGDTEESFVAGYMTGD
jgi:hypothetical protein